MDRDAAGTYETQFISQSDDGDRLYNVEKILDEKGRKYKVQWEGIDPATGKKWKPDWVPKTDCTDGLISEWKREKEARKRRAASAKSSSSASGSVTSRLPVARHISTSKKPKPKSRLGNAPTSPVSEARSNSSAPSRTSALSKPTSAFVVEIPTHTGRKRPRESDVKAAPLSPVKRLRLNGPASPLPASPFDDDDGGTAKRKQVGPVTYKRRKPIVGKSPLAKKVTGPLVGKASKITSHNAAGSSRAKPLILSSPRIPLDKSIKRMTTSSTNRKDVQDSATEDEDSDPQLPDQLRPSKRSSPKGLASARPATRSRQSDVPPKPISSRSDEAEDPDPETFIRPHPTTSARTRPTPARDPSTSRTNQRDIKKSVRGDIPKRVSAQNMFPTVVKSNQGRPSGDTEKSSAESTKLAGLNNMSEIRHAEAENRQPEPPLPAESGSGPSPTKSVSFRADEVGGQDNGDDGERVMSSVDLEKAKVLSQQASPGPSSSRNNAHTSTYPQPGSQPQSQSQGNSSKGTVVSDSQVPVQAQNFDVSTKSPPLPESRKPPSPSPTRAAPSKPRHTSSSTKLKLRPSEMLRLGKGILIKPRPSVAETESTLIELIPPELAMAQAQAQSESEYDPQGSRSRSQSTESTESKESNEAAPVTPRSSDEESKSETDEIDSNANDDDEEIGGDGPSFRTRSQSFSQSKPEFRPLWDDSPPTRRKRPELKGEEQADKPFPDEDEDDQEEAEGPIPTSSPSLGGGRFGSVGPDHPKSPTRHRTVVEVVLPSSRRSSQKPLSQASRATDLPQEEPTQQASATQEAALEADNSAQAQLDGGEERPENEQENSPNNQDQSLAHVMEIDALLNVSHQLIEDDLETTTAAEGDPQRADTSGSVIDLCNTTTDVSQSVLDLDDHATRVDISMDPVQPVEGPAPPPLSQPESQPQTSSSSFLNLPKVTAPVPPAYLPRLLSESSQSQHLLPATQDPAQLSQNPVSQQLHSQFQPLSQPQDHTHSSIEEPASWSFPLAQPPRPADTISSFTPSNPSTKAPRTSGEHSAPSTNPLPPSSNHFPPTVNGGDHSFELPHTQSSARISLPSTFGPIPELSTDVFRQQRSPGSDIDQFESPPAKTTLTFSQGAPVSSPELRKPQDVALEIQFSGPDTGHDSDFRVENERMVESLREAESKLAARDHRLVELTSELEQLRAEKKREEAVFEANMAQSNAIVHQQQETYTAELSAYETTIADLQLQLKTAQSQSEIAESQREAALEQYMIASNEAKSLADINKALNQRVGTLEKQVTTGLMQWRSGFETNMERKQQELKQLQTQLDLEREIRARTDGREIRRRAAEWFELKKRVDDLEAENLQVEQEAGGLRKREAELRLREQEVTQREKVLERLPVPPSQSQTDRGLSQDDMQTETLLSDRSAVLADLDGPAGEDMVWMCTYRSSSDRLCGQAFDTMGLLLGHVLDASGHKVDAGCQCN